MMAHIISTLMFFSGFLLFAFLPLPSRCPLFSLFPPHHRPHPPPPRHRRCPPSCRCRPTHPLDPKSTSVAASPPTLIPAHRFLLPQAARMLSPTVPMPGAIAVCALWTDLHHLYKLLRLCFRHSILYPLRKYPCLFALSLANCCKQ